MYSIWDECTSHFYSAIRSLQHQRLKNDNHKNEMRRERKTRRCRITDITQYIRIDIAAEIYGITIKIVALRNLKLIAIA